MDDDPLQEPFLTTDLPEDLDFFNDALAEHTHQPDQLEILRWPTNEAVTEYTLLDAVAPVLDIVSHAPVVGSETRTAPSEPAPDALAGDPAPSVKDGQGVLMQHVADVSEREEAGDLADKSPIALEEERSPAAYLEAMQREEIPEPSIVDTKDMFAEASISMPAPCAIDAVPEGTPEVIIQKNSWAISNDANQYHGEIPSEDVTSTLYQAEGETPELVATEIIETLVALVSRAAKADTPVTPQNNESISIELTTAAAQDLVQATTHGEGKLEPLQESRTDPRLEETEAPVSTSTQPSAVFGESDDPIVVERASTPSESRGSESLTDPASNNITEPKPMTMQDLPIVIELDGVDTATQLPAPRDDRAPEALEESISVGDTENATLSTPTVVSMTTQSPTTAAEPANAAITVQASLPEGEEAPDALHRSILSNVLEEEKTSAPKQMRESTNVEMPDDAVILMQPSVSKDEHASNPLRDSESVDILPETRQELTTMENLDATNIPSQAPALSDAVSIPPASPVLLTAVTAASSVDCAPIAAPALQVAMPPGEREMLSAQTIDDLGLPQEPADSALTSSPERHAQEIPASPEEDLPMVDVEADIAMADTNPLYRETSFDVDYPKTLNHLSKALLRSDLAQEQTPDTHTPSTPIRQIALETVDLVTPSPSSSSRALSIASLPPDAPPLRQGNFSVQIPASTLVSPASHYEPFEAPAPELAEWKAVDALCREHRRLKLGTDGYVEFNLDDFAVYVDASRYPNEMRSLHFLDTRTGHSNCFFDGRLSVGELSYYVRRVPIAALPIEGYTDPDTHTVQDSIWLHSAHNSRRHLYYRLRKPATEYIRFHEPFVWVADLAKHFVDFLDAMEEERTKVTMHFFTRKFSNWLLARHGSAPEFLRWGRRHRSGDFRTSVAANIDFLYKEAYGVLGHKKLEFHPLWNETMRFNGIKREPSRNAPHDPTLVTEYIRDCFSHLPFGDRLECIPFSETTKKLRRRVIRKRRLEMPAPLHDGAAGLSTTSNSARLDIKPGDTISTTRDGAESGTQWKREVSKGFQDVDRWFARVQKVSWNRRGKRVFDVIWYYRPVDTLCGLMKYPWGNELFLSDHCSCDESAKITEDEVLGVHDVDLWATSATQKDLFCRQTYIAAERKWISLDEKHLQCEHVRGEETTDVPTYRVGETVLARLDRASDRSEPCEVSRLDEGLGTVLLRRLRRRRDVDPAGFTSPPNELLWTTEFVECKESRILAKCHTRVFPAASVIPAPYDRNGVGSFFFITHESTDDEGVVPLEEPPATLRQGFDPHQRLPRLRGLDLFCGGGNFGRGLEDGGAVEMRWLNDYNEQAIHTYMANVADPEAVNPFLGSIDDMQRQAMLGKFSKNVPKIGDVDFISAGSPCPGFSNLTNDKTTVQQRKNQSLVAAFGSFIDLYRPQYGLLENVRGIVQKKANRDQDVFSQLICAIVGLGYQTQFFFLDASSCGSPQSRPRVFMVFAAPGCRLPNKPPITHSHPPSTKSLSLGLLPNGEPMTEREMPDATPFKFVSAAEACEDLPPIYDAKPDSCIAFPDHRVALGITRDVRLQMSVIPTQPWGMNFALAWYGMDRGRAGSGVLTPSDRDLFPADAGKRTIGRTLANSSAFGRMNPNRPINTIVTRQSPGDAKNGQQMHWHEPRVITLMEARRAQGFLDHEVLLGSVRDQYRIVGNSVAREVAVALGLMIREAEFGSLTDGEEDLSRLMDVEVDDSADDELDLADDDVRMLKAEHKSVIAATGTNSTVASTTYQTTSTSLKRRRLSPSSSMDTSHTKRQRHDIYIHTETFSHEGMHDEEEALDELAI